jgi:hypothetical protein
MSESRGPVGPKRPEAKARENTSDVQRGVVNPQFADITYRNNSDSSNYHSLQTQATLRPTHGFNYQATYTWSRALGIFGNYRDVMNQRADYTLQSTHRTHDFRSYGHIGSSDRARQADRRNSSGWLARSVEGSKFGTILNVTSGAPLNVVGQNTLYTSGTPDIVGDFPRQGKVVWRCFWAVGGDAF